jgi:hypothetical protein
MVNLHNQTHVVRHDTQKIGWFLFFVSCCTTSCVARHDFHKYLSHCVNTPLPIPFRRALRYHYEDSVNRELIPVSNKLISRFSDSFLDKVKTIWTAKIRSSSNWVVRQFFVASTELCQILNRAAQAWQGDQIFLWMGRNTYIERSPSQILSYYIFLLKIAQICELTVDFLYAPNEQ